jgi:adenylylsulfate kinase-like enzyme
VIPSRFELATGRYIQNGYNLLLLGLPGVGKSYLAIALGIKACKQGVRTLFVTATALITTLDKGAGGRQAGRAAQTTQSAAAFKSMTRLAICRSTARAPTSSSSWSRAVMKAVRSWRVEEAGDGVTIWHSPESPQSGRCVAAGVGTNLQ